MEPEPTMDAADSAGRWTDEYSLPTGGERLGALLRWSTVIGIVLAVPVVIALGIADSKALDVVVISAVAAFFALASLPIALAARRLQKDPDHRACLKTRIVVVHLPVDQAMKLCREAITSIPRAEIEAAGATDVVVATLPPNRASFGEYIRATVSTLEPSNTRVRIESWSRYALALFDWGRNRGIVEKVASLIESRDHQD